MQNLPYEQGGASCSKNLPSKYCPRKDKIPAIYSLFYASEKYQLSSSNTYSMAKKKTIKEQPAKKLQTKVDVPPPHFFCDGRSFRALSFYETITLVDKKKGQKKILLTCNPKKPNENNFLNSVVL
jgi:hypothetical protein